MIIKTTPDNEKVKSVLRLIKEREEFISFADSSRFSTSVVENYYEIIKELAGALILLDGLKATGENAHKDLINYLINYEEFLEEDIVFMNDLRIKRNNSSYEGKRINSVYFQNNKNKILSIILRLKEIIKRRINYP
ncbi:hypothetical protein J4225_02550 [Candidatus Pacearchaeota archaeon]|nr:hypothetical protein [Candidatus Pacearchaeota archaeon]